MAQNHFYAPSEITSKVQNESTKTTNNVQSQSNPSSNPEAEWKDMQQLVRRIARRYHLPQNSPLEEEDLLQEGYVGWLEAKRRFNAEKLSCEPSHAGNLQEAFQAYAAHWVHKYITDALHRYRSALSYPPSHPLNDSLPVCSLDTIVHQGDEEAGAITLADVLPDTAPTPEQKMLHEEEKQMLQTALQRLTARERMIIVRLYGLEGEDAKTVSEMAKELQISCSRVRMIRARAMRKMTENKRGTIRYLTGR